MRNKRIFIVIGNLENKLLIAQDGDILVVE